MMSKILFLIFGFLLVAAIGKAELVNSGSTYVRWGNGAACRSDSPQSFVLYRGFAAGGMASKKGDSSGYLCLKDDARYSATEEPHKVSWIYPTKYRTFNIDVPSDNDDTHDRDLSCTVCRAGNSQGRRSVITIPAAVDCPSRDWTKEYDGYLMGNKESSGFKTTEYICVDRIFRTNSGSILDHDGSSEIYFAAGDCTKSFLPCQPYQRNIPIPCVVCSI